MKRVDRDGLDTFLEPIERKHIMKRKKRLGFDGLGAEEPPVPGSTGP